MPVILIDDKLLKPKDAVIEKDWRLWEKKTFNIHRGLIEWSATSSGSIDVIANRIRAGVRTEFNPGKLRGFGFGTILHVSAALADFGKICNHIDRRNKSNGVWQWAVVCFDQENVALGIHTWLHGYLRPVYESVLSQLATQGYECHSVEAEIDPLIETLTRIGKVCHLIGGIAEIIT